MLHVTPHSYVVNTSIKLNNVLYVTKIIYMYIHMNKINMQAYISFELCFMIQFRKKKQNSWLFLLLATSTGSFLTIDWLDFTDWEKRESDEYLVMHKNIIIMHILILKLTYTVVCMCNLCFWMQLVHFHVFRVR